MKKLLAVLTLLLVLALCPAVFADGNFGGSAMNGPMQQNQTGPAMSDSQFGSMPDGQMPGSGNRNTPAMGDAPSDSMTDGTTSATLPGGRSGDGQLPSDDSSRRGPMMGEHAFGAQPDSSTEDGQLPSDDSSRRGPMMGGRTDSGSSGMRGENAKKHGPTRPGNEAPDMIDFDEMVAKGVISQETCDRIKAWIAANLPADLPEMNGPDAAGELPADLPEMNGPDAAGELPGDPPETDGQSAPDEGGLLQELLDAEVITQEEYDAISAAQAADAA